MNYCRCPLENKIDSLRQAPHDFPIPSNKGALLLATLILFLTLPCQSYFAQEYSWSSIAAFGNENTLDIATWNMRFFPSAGDATIQAASEAMTQLGMDIWALQEIYDSTSLEKLISRLGPKYDFYQARGFLNLAYVYRKDRMEVIGFEELFPDSFLDFPRPPLVMTIVHQEDTLVIINNHWKCCGDGILKKEDRTDEELRRYRAADALERHIDTHYPSSPVILLGDLNDLLTDSGAHNVFLPFLSRPELYTFCDLAIATGPQECWSLPSFPAHLDHIMITNELFERFENTASTVQTLRLDSLFIGGYPAYTEILSDHRPVALRLISSKDLLTNTFSKAPESPVAKVYPTIFSSTVYVEVPPEERLANIRLTDIHGRKVYAPRALEGDANITHIETHYLVHGIYLLTLTTQSGKSFSTKLIKTF